MKLRRLQIEGHKTLPACDIDFTKSALINAIDQVRGIHRTIPQDGVATRSDSASGNSELFNLPGLTEIHIEIFLSRSSLKGNLSTKLFPFRGDRREMSINVDVNTCTTMLLSSARSINSSVVDENEKLAP